MSGRPCPDCHGTGIIAGTGWQTCSCPAGLATAGELAASAARGVARRAAPEPGRRRPLLDDVAAAIQRLRRTIEPRHIGRPRGSRNKERARLVAEVRANPAMTPEEIDRRGVALGIWQDTPGDYEVIGKRVRNLRRDAAGQ